MSGCYSVLECHNLFSGVKLNIRSSFILRNEIRLMNDLDYRISSVASYLHLNLNFEINSGVKCVARASNRAFLKWGTVEIPHHNFVPLHHSLVAPRKNFQKDSVLLKVPPPPTS